MEALESKAPPEAPESKDIAVAAAAEKADEEGGNMDMPDTAASAEAMAPTWLPGAIR